MTATFNLFLIVMSILALIVFIALRHVNAGYGIFADRKWGILISNRIGWLVMEAPVFLVMGLLWITSDRAFQPVPLTMFILFQLHYLQRAFIYPFLLRGKSRMPIGIIAMGMIFNVLNALMQGGWIFWVSPPGRYPVEWFWSLPFIVGTMIFIAGMVINLHSDHIIRTLRQPGDTRHHIPRGGMFRYVSSANYFGEIVEWTGFALLSWSWSGAVFAWWTFANLVPRAAATYKKYSEEFGEEFIRLRRRIVIPFIY